MKREAIIASLDIGASIKKLRESRGLSQDELAKDICDRTTITKLENGLSKIPSFIFVLQICDKLNITVDEFINYALSNSYSLDKKTIVSFLINNNISQLGEYLSNIDFNTLNINDQKFYNYLIAKIYINENKFDKAKEYLLLSITNYKNFKKDNIVELLSYHELLKYNLIIPKTQTLEKILMDGILDIESTDPRYFYLLNESINECIANNSFESVNKLLEKQLSYINKNSAYTYLPLYYKNKMNLNPNDEKLKRELNSKLKAITSINKISHQ